MRLSSSKNLNEALASIGIKEPMDVILHTPRRYESYRETEKKTFYAEKERIVRIGHIINGKPRPLRFANRTLYRFDFECENGEIFLVEAWNRAYLSNFLEDGETYTIIGTYSKRRHALSMINLKKGAVEEEHALKPVYSLPESISQYAFQTLVRRCFEMVGTIPDEMPIEIRKKYRLASYQDALRLVHFPKTYEDVHKGMRVLKYRDALIFELRTSLVRGANRALRKPRNRPIDYQIVQNFVNALPYPLTADQKKALNDCLKDMDSKAVMYRLLQGDVGTGKTLVAALCAYANHTRSAQTALLAPTDALARQHYRTLKKLFEGTNMEVGLLVGAMSGAEKHAVLQDLSDGTLDMVVGTHALFSKSVEYAYLGLAIIDEQQKFGVNQRSLLLGKGEHADLLLMSATPIPRTLTMTLYGDLDISSLYMFPSGKRDVETRMLSPVDEKIQKLIKESIESKHRVYIVVPQIEGKDALTSVKQVYEDYEKRYPGRVAMMHGKMSEEELNVASLAFQSGLCPILVATSLIEVGIDVRAANLMVIYSPNHFSLSSLHQLRGRIGRDGSHAICVLAYDYGPEDEAKEKLDVILETEDGFKIAEADLKLRGPGDVAGVRQSGLPEFGFANIIDDFKIFECARDDATALLEDRYNPHYLEIIDLASNEAEGFQLV